MQPTWKQSESNFTFDKSLLVADKRAHVLIWCPVVSQGCGGININCVIKFQDANMATVSHRPCTCTEKLISL